MGEVPMELRFQEMETLEPSASSLLSKACWFGILEFEALRGVIGLF